MCGIVGVCAANLFSIGAHARARAMSALSHRGPDAQGLYAYDGKVSTSSDDAGLNPCKVFLGHKRLSILDLSPRSHQPMRSADNLAVLAFNGEIYNFKELRGELQTLGVAFQTTGDSEVIVEGYRRWGTGLFSKLVGMFALALLDLQRQSLFLVRDHFGIKPLYYRLGNHKLYFASEIAPLLAIAEHTPAINQAMTYSYLVSGITDNSAETFYDQIHQLSAAHYVEHSLVATHLSNITPIRYWYPPQSINSDITYEEASAQIRELFLRSVALHLRSDVSVGVLLSGGIDSSAIACSIKHLVPEAPIETFSFISDNQSINEERWIDIVSVATGYRSHKVSFNFRANSDDLNAFIRAQGEPIPTSTVLAQYAVFQAVSKAGYKVVLDGQGADELFAGYIPFILNQLITLLHDGNFGRGFSLLYSLLAGKTALSNPFVKIIEKCTRVISRRIHGHSSISSIFDKKQLSLLGCTAPAFASPALPLRQALNAAFYSTRLPMLLKWEDRSSMAHSVESRVPFLLPELVAFVQTLPTDYFVDDRGTTKSVFRDAMRGILPDQTRARRDKLGFATPEAQWLRANRAAVCATLRRFDPLHAPLLEPTRLASFISEFERGATPSNESVWRLFCLAAWVEQCVLRKSLAA